MGLSVNQFTYAGDDEFDLNFALGYSSRGDVTCYKKGPPSVDLDFDWLTPSRVRLTPGHGLVNGDEIVFRRTVSKQVLPVDLAQPGNATRENLSLLSKHVIYALHEVLDERAADFPTEVLPLPVELGGTGATNSAAAASNLGILAGVNILHPANNLSDLHDAAVARTNLGLGTAAETDSSAYATAAQGAKADAALPRSDKATTAEAQAGTNDTKYMTPAKTFSAVRELALGEGQTWQNVAGSRVSGTAYQNTTGRPIQWAVHGSSGGRAQVSADGITWVTLCKLGAPLEFETSAAPVIPNWHYYRTTGHFSVWAEFR